MTSFSFLSLLPGSAGVAVLTARVLFLGDGGGESSELFADVCWRLLTANETIFMRRRSPGSLLVRKENGGVLLTGGF
jgi:hypothetical protein